MQGKRNSPHFSYYTKVIISYKKINVNRSGTKFFAFFWLFGAKKRQKYALCADMVLIFSAPTAKIREHSAALDIN